MHGEKLELKIIRISILSIVSKAILNSLEKRLVRLLTNMLFFKHFNIEMPSNCDKSVY